jgi:hypothetical protein
MGTGTGLGRAHGFMCSDIQDGNDTQELYIKKYNYTVSIQVNILQVTVRMACVCVWKTSVMAASVTSSMGAAGGGHGNPVWV